MPGGADLHPPTLGAVGHQALKDKCLGLLCLTYNRADSGPSHRSASGWTELASVLGPAELCGINECFDHFHRMAIVRLPIPAGPIQRQTQNSEPVILSLILKLGFGLALAGTLLGLPAAFGGSFLLRHLVPGVSPLDYTSFAIAAAGVFLAILLACYLPARRASRVDPMTALRHE